MALLNNLNFETLIAPTPKPHYWIEDVVLSDAASLALLQGSRGRSQSAEKRLLLVGDPLSASPRIPATATSGHRDRPRRAPLPCQISSGT